MNALDKAREARQNKRQDTIWEQIETLKVKQYCTCTFTPGMTYEDLSKIEGCKSPQYVCSVLDRYRRLTESGRKDD